VVRGGKSGNGRETASPGYCDWTRCGSPTNEPSARSSSFGRPNATGLYFGSWHKRYDVGRVEVEPYQRRGTSTFYAGLGGKRTGTGDVRPKWETIWQSWMFTQVWLEGWHETGECTPAVHKWTLWALTRSASVVISMNVQKGEDRIFRGEECRGGSVNSKWHDNVHCSVWYNKKNPSDSVIFSFWICFILTNTQLNYAVTSPLFNYMFQNLSSFHWQG
jgi:hypothetical protein